MTYYPQMHIWHVGLYACGSVLYIGPKYSYGFGNNFSYKLVSVTQKFSFVVLCLNCDIYYRATLC